MNPRDTVPMEPVQAVPTATGNVALIPASVADGLAWSLRKWALMQGPPPLSSDEAERIVQAEMRASERDE